MPALQGVHAAAAAPPEYMPGEQGAQLLAPVTALPLAKVLRPAAQSKHTDVPPGVYLPWAHFLHRLDPITSEKWPGLHGRHDLAPSNEYAPVEQPMQLSEMEPPFLLL